MPARHSFTTFMDNVEPQPNGCWLWTVGSPGQPYGLYRINNRRQGAHRWAYEFMVGPIPDGLHIDHLCRTPKCVNPDHMEPVTRAENYRRGIGFAGIHSRQTHCIHGHEFTPENTLVRTRAQGGRQCRACNHINSQHRNARRRLTGRRAA